MAGAFAPAGGDVGLCSKCATNAARFACRCCSPRMLLCAPCHDSRFKRGDLASPAFDALLETTPLAAPSSAVATAAPDGPTTVAVAAASSAASVVRGAAGGYSSNPLHRGPGELSWRSRSVSVCRACGLLPIADGWECACCPKAFTVCSGCFEVRALVEHGHSHVWFHQFCEHQANRWRQEPALHFEPATFTAQAVGEFACDCGRVVTASGWACGCCNPPCVLCATCYESRAKRRDQSTEAETTDHLALAAIAHAADAAIAALASSSGDSLQFNFETDAAPALPASAGFSQASSSSSSGQTLASHATSHATASGATVSSNSSFDFGAAVAAPQPSFAATPAPAFVAARSRDDSAPMGFGQAKGLEDSLPADLQALLAQAAADAVAATRGDAKTVANRDVAFSSVRNQELKSHLASERIRAPVLSCFDQDECFARWPLGQSTRALASHIGSPRFPRCRVHVHCVAANEAENFIDRPVQGVAAAAM